MSDAPRRVLVAEDSFLPALEIKSVLTELGFSVVGPAATTKEALDLLAETPDLELALLDVHLRDGTCAPIVRELCARAIRFCLVTGYTDPDLGDALEGLPPPPIVSKPFSHEKLVEAIEAITRRGG